MHIKHSVELPDGSYTYQGVFEGKELDYLVQYAVNDLLRKGAFPFMTQESMEESASPMPDHVTEQ